MPKVQPQVEIIDNDTGDVIQVKPDELRAAKIEFTLSDGLKGIDKMLVTQSLKEIINMLLQSQVARDYDMGAIIDYFLELSGERLDFTQFKYQSPLDALPPEYKELAFMLLKSMDQQALQEELMKMKAQQQTPAQAQGAKQTQPQLTAQAPSAQK